jgi:DNA-binding PadR family transcriptional regulator
MMILGLVKWLQPVHGYDVRRELMSWQVDEWANIQPGSIYHALRKLTEDGLLEEVATEQVGARPARTTYRVTPAGDREFDDMLRASWWDYRQPVDPFGPAFSFLPHLPRREAVVALRQRAEALLDRVDGLDKEISGHASEIKPVHVTWFLELHRARAEAEIAWCLRVADRIEAGEGRHNAEIDLAEQGRVWREAIRMESRGREDDA